LILPAEVLPVALNPEPVGGPPGGVYHSDNPSVGVGRERRERRVGMTRGRAYIV